MDEWLETRLASPLEIAGSPFKPTGKYSRISDERKAVYAPDYSVVTTAAAVISVPGEVDGEPVELVGAVVNSGDSYNLEILSGTCKIMYDDLSVSQFVEYCFPDAPEWKLAAVGDVALQEFKAHKYKAWKDRLDSPTCEAEFRRMLQLGLVNKVFDKHIFPTPDALKDQYLVTDDNGKQVDIPHSVSGLRVWDVAEQKYREISPILDGAPADDEVVAAWENILADFRATKGEEYINGLLGPRSG
jgi:hypothetical protein